MLHLQTKTRGRQMKQWIMGLLLVTGVILAGCIKDEELNAEADIETAWLSVDDAGAVFYSAGDSLVEVLSSESEICFRVREGVDLTALAPQFTLTEGATVSPASGSVHDFSEGSVEYVVTSESGAWSRTYSVSVRERQRTVDEVEVFEFEDFALESSKEQYYVWSDLLADGWELGNWASGNAGYAISMSSAAADAYPTVPLKDGVNGYGVCLTTLSTGPLGKLVGKSIAAGNLYLGKFDTQKALTQTLQATIFGLPVEKAPERLEGWYKYERGATFQDAQSQTVADRLDEGNIYGVLFLNTDSAGNSFLLHGDDVKSSGQIVAIADFVVEEETDEWTYFAVDFNYLSEVDEERLEEYGYSFTLVATSSIEGASFEGAIGSTLMIDAITVRWSEE